MEPRPEEMPTEPVWLDRTIVAYIHEDQIRQHGGLFGVRDEGLLESALARPRQRWTYEPESDLAALAAAYAFGIAKNHPFLDANKRVAFMAAYTFLRVNGLHLVAPEPEAVQMMLDVAAGELGEPELAAWLRQRAVPQTGGPQTGGPPG